MTVHEYAEQDHAFTREGGKHYDEAAKQLADGRTIAFLNENARMRRALIAAAAGAGGVRRRTDRRSRWSSRVRRRAALAPANLPAFFDCLRENGATVGFRASRRASERA